MKITYCNTIVAVALATATISCQTSPSAADYQLFNDNWTFLRTDSTFSATDSINVLSGKLPTTAETVTLPHTSRLEPMTVNDQWQGICYYAKSFPLTENELSKTLFLKFEGAMNVADVWLNGTHVSNHMGGYLPFLVALNSHAKAGDNTIVVRLDNTDNAVTGPKPLNILDFNTYGGIYRDVKLIAENEIYISDPNIGRKDAGIAIATKVDKQQANISISVDIVNTSAAPRNISIVNAMVDADGKVVATAKNDTTIAANANALAHQQLTVATPKLWSPDAPNLYRVVTTVLSGNTPMDTQTTRIGLRQIEITPDALTLNGEKTFLRGVNRHQEFPYVGYAASNEAQRRDAYKIKQAGFDYVRASHYPPSPAFLDACDELGIFVLDAILGWQYFGDAAFEAHALTSSRELIRRDRNHACILAWELSINETYMPESFRNAVATVRDEEQPGTYTAGWMKEGYDIYVEARQHRHGVDTTRPLIVSEYGDWEYYAQNAGLNQDGWADLLQEERTSRQPRESGEARMLQQALNLQEAHNDNLSTHAFADGYWVMFDYNRGYADDIEYSGVMDIFRLPKFSYYLYQSQRPAIGTSQFNKPMVYVASHCTDSSSTQVRVFSNCETVRLFADGKEIHNPTVHPAFSSNLCNKPLTFDVGTVMPTAIEAVGYIAGDEVCRHKVARPEAPAALTLRADIDDVPAKAGVNDNIFLCAQIVDSNGTIVPNANDEVKFEIVGDALFATPTKLSKTFTTTALGGIASSVVVVGSSTDNIVVQATCGNMTATFRF